MSREIIIYGDFVVCEVSRIKIPSKYWTLIEGNDYIFPVLAEAQLAKKPAFSYRSHLGINCWRFNIRAKKNVSNFLKKYTEKNISSKQYIKMISLFTLFLRKIGSHTEIVV